MDGSGELRIARVDAERVTESETDAGTDTDTDTESSTETGTETESDTDDFCACPVPLPSDIRTFDWCFLGNADIFLCDGIGCGSAVDKNANCGENYSGAYCGCLSDGRLETGVTTAEFCKEDGGTPYYKYVPGDEASAGWVVHDCEEFDLSTAD